MESRRGSATRSPEYVGELYLESCRGTYTSIFGIKRANRLAETALRSTEFLATVAALRGLRGRLRGTGYPHNREAERNGTHVDARFGVPVARVEQTNMLEDRRH